MHTAIFQAQDIQGFLEDENATKDAAVLNARAQ